MEKTGRTLFCAIFGVLVAARSAWAEKVSICTGWEKVASVQLEQGQTAHKAFWTPEDKYFCVVTLGPDYEDDASIVFFDGKSFVRQCELNFDPELNFVDLVEGPPKTWRALFQGEKHYLEASVRIEPSGDISEVEWGEGKARRLGYRIPSDGKEPMFGRLDADAEKNLKQRVRDFSGNLSGSNGEFEDGAAFVTIPEKNLKVLFNGQGRHVYKKMQHTTGNPWIPSNGSVSSDATQWVHIKFRDKGLMTIGSSVRIGGTMDGPYCKLPLNSFFAREVQFSNTNYRFSLVDDDGHQVWIFSRTGKGDI